MDDRHNLPTKPAPIGRGDRRCQFVGRWNRRCPIFCRAEALDEILDYSALDLHRERGGFLIGGAFVDRTPYVEIRHFVPARDTIGASGSMRFTHETWAGLNRELESSYPGQRVVGWQHTHPNLGIFLSSYDRFIHRNFFSQPWQVAMVVDPRRCELGFFQWIDDRLIDVGFALTAEASDRRAG